MKEIKLENMALSLSDENGDIRVKSNDNNIILTNQNIENVSELIKHNFNIVSQHYKLIMVKSEEKIHLKDINEISIAIVLSLYV